MTAARLGAHPRLLLATALTLANLVVYAQVAGFDFVQFDDARYVSENPRVLAGLTPQGVAWAFTSTTLANWHPLTWLSLMLDATLGGHDPRVFHLTNLALHMANTLLLFHWMQRMTGRLLRSGFVAVLFAVHPLHVESVAWVAERKDVLSTLFWMLVLLAYLRYVERPSSSRYALVAAALACGLMSKPMLVTLPLVLLLVDYWPLGRLERATVWPRLREKLPLLALSAASSAVTLYAQWASGAVASLELFPPSLRVANAMISITAYLGKTLWPAGLAVPYPFDREAVTLASGAGALLLVAAVSLAVFRGSARWPYLTVGWLWYLITLVPVIGLVQVGTQSMADRYTYVPLIGPFIIVAWGAPELASRLLPGLVARAFVPLAAGATVIALTVAAHVQAALWKDSWRLFTHTLGVTHSNSVAHNALGITLHREGRFEEALEHYREALRISPSSVEIRGNMAASLIESGHVDEAIALYREALDRSPGDSKIQANLATALLRKGERGEAAALASLALEAEEAEPLAHKVLGAVRAEEGKEEEAFDHFQEALRANPADVETLVNVGTLLLRQRRFDHAAERLTEALRLEPDNLSAHQNLGVVLVRQGKLALAIPHFEHVLRLDPGNAGARNNLERARALLHDEVGR